MSGDSLPQGLVQRGHGLSQLDKFGPVEHDEVAEAMRRVTGVVRAGRVDPHRVHKVGKGKRKRADASVGTTSNGPFV